MQIWCLWHLESFLKTLQILRVSLLDLARTLRCHELVSLGITSPEFEVKRQLFLRRKATTNLDSILKTETSLCQQKSI